MGFDMRSYADIKFAIPSETGDVVVKDGRYFKCLFPCCEPPKCREVTIDRAVVEVESHARRWDVVDEVQITFYDFNEASVKAFFELINKINDRLRKEGAARRIEFRVIVYSDMSNFKDLFDASKVQAFMRVIP